MISTVGRRRRRSNMNRVRVMARVNSQAWIVLFASFMSLFFNCSLAYTIGIIHTALLEYYPNAEVTTISWIGTLYSSITWLAAFLGSIVINVFNVRTCIIVGAVLNLVGCTLSSLVTDFRWLFLTFGLIVGCGQSLCYTASLVVLGYHFDKDAIGLATGIANSATGVSIFVLPPLTEHLVDVYGLHGTFLLLGGFGFHAVIFGYLMSPSKYEISKHDLAEEDNINKLPTKLSKASTCVDIKKLLKLSSFWKVMVTSLFFGASLSTMYLFLPEYFRQNGSSKQEAAFVISVTGVLGIFSRIILGSLCSVIDPVLLLMGTCGVAGIVTMFINRMSSLASRLCYGVVLGLYTGGGSTLIYILVVEISGASTLSTTYGLVVVSCGIGFLTGPPLTESLASHLQDQYYIFVFIAAFFFLTVLSAVYIRINPKPVPEQSVDQFETITHM